MIQSVYKISHISQRSFQLVTFMTQVYHLIIDDKTQINIQIMNAEKLEALNGRFVPV